MSRNRAVAGRERSGTGLRATPRSLWRRLPGRRFLSPIPHWISATLLALSLLVRVAHLTANDVASWIISEGGTFTRDANGLIIEVDLTSTWITDADLEKLAQLPRLSRITLAHTWITDVGLEHLKPLDDVIDLNLYYTEYITDGGVAHIKHWKRLEHLNLRGTKVTSRVFEHVGNLTTLKSLDVGFSRVTDDGFEHLAELAQLDSLGFAGNKMSGVSLPLLELLPSLKHLDVGGLQRTDSGPWGLALSDFNLESIEALTELETLNLRDSKITYRGLARLEALVNLEALDLSRTPIMSRGLASLAKLPKMRTLRLWQVEKVDDEVATYLAAFENLEVLDLSETSVTDCLLPKLAELPNLKQLFLGGSKVTQQAVEQFHTDRPSVQVTWWEKHPEPERYQNVPP